MEAGEYIQPGMSKELSFQVESAHTAVSVGSGSLDVLATPSMIAFMERIAYELIEEHLPEGFSNVGTLVEVRHMAPTPIGGIIRVQVDVIDVQGRGVSFNVQAWDGQEMVGEGRHQRVVIDVTRFVERMCAKQT